MELATNIFTGGLLMDLNPLTLKNNTLSDCLNGTIVTMSGNEVILQNDMGNRKINGAFLPSGYEPVGIKEYGGIIYVAAYNPLNNLCLIGSFPSPQRTGNETDNSGSIDFNDFIKDSAVAKTSILTLITKRPLRVGDKYTFYSEDIHNDSEFYKTYIEKKDGKNNLFTLIPGVLNSLNEFIDISHESNDYFIKSTGLDKYDSSTDGTFILYRLKKAIDTYSQKMVSPLYIKTNLNTIQRISYEYDGEKISGTEYKLYFTITYYHNSPTDFKSYCPEFDSGSADITLDEDGINYISEEYDSINDLYLTTYKYTLIITPSTTITSPINFEIRFTLDHKGFYEEDKIYLNYLTFNIDIDLSKLRSDYIALNGWRYYNGDGFIKLDLDIEAYPKKDDETKLKGLYIEISKNTDESITYELIPENTIIKSGRKEYIIENASDILNAPKALYTAKFKYNKLVDNESYTYTYIENTEYNYINTELFNGNYYGQSPLIAKEEDTHYGVDDRGNIYYDYEYMNDLYINDFNKISAVYVTPEIKEVNNNTTKQNNNKGYVHMGDMSYNIEYDPIIPIPIGSDSLNEKKYTYLCKHTNTEKYDLELKSSVKNSSLYPADITTSGLTIEVNEPLTIEVYNEDEVIELLSSISNVNKTISSNIIFTEKLSGLLHKNNYTINQVIKSFYLFLIDNDIFYNSFNNSKYYNLSYWQSPGEFTINSYESISFITSESRDPSARVLLGDIENYTITYKSKDGSENGTSIKGLSLKNNLEKISNCFLEEDSDNLFTVDLDKEDFLYTMRTKDKVTPLSKGILRCWLRLPDNKVFPIYSARVDTGYWEYGDHIDELNREYIRKFSTRVLPRCLDINRYYNFERNRKYTNLFYSIKNNITTNYLNIDEIKVKNIIPLNLKFTNSSQENFFKFIPNITYTKEYNVTLDHPIRDIEEVIESNTIETALMDGENGNLIYLTDGNGLPLDPEFVYKKDGEKLIRAYLPDNILQIKGKYIIPNLHLKELSEEKDGLRYILGNNIFVPDISTIDPSDPSPSEGSLKEHFLFLIDLKIPNTIHSISPYTYDFDLSLLAGLDGQDILVNDFYPDFYN